MIPLTKEEKKTHNQQNICYICKKIFSTDDKNKKYHKLKDHCHYTGEYRGAAHDICNLRHKIPKEIPVVFHNGSTYDYHFIIKKLAEEFEGEFECLGENTEKYITFQYQSKRKLQKKIRMAMIKLQKYHTKQSLFLVLDLCQGHYQTLLIIYLKDFVAISAQIVNLILTIIWQPKMNNYFLGVLSAKRIVRKTLITS